jgi:filamentous hemagglutinin family protein
LALVGAIAGGVSDRVIAQIVPDATLEAESSKVTPNVRILGLPSDQIDGGAIRGKNLFHSFEQFNVDAGRGAYFSNPNGVENILSRVTGSNASKILGTLGVRGTANLFLINPNGIIFGPNARLNVNGSFVATTANAIQFGNQNFFSASAPDVPPVLTVNPSALLFNQIATGSITNQSTAGLRVLDGRSLLLVGGDVKLDRGILQALGGRVELGGLTEAGTVQLDVDGNDLHLRFPDGVARATVSLTNRAVVDASGQGKGGGDVQVQSRLVTLTDGSKIVANSQGSEPGGTLTVTAFESVKVIGTSADGSPSSLSTQAQGSGTGGTLTIETGKLIVRDGAQVGTGTFSEGQGGTLTVTASEAVEVIGTSADDSPSGLFTQTQEGSGSAGALKIETGNLIVQAGAQISTSTLAKGQGGTLTVSASSVELSGTSADGMNSSGLFAVTKGGSGSAGALSIETERLIVQNGAQVSASTFGGAQERGGTLTVNASDSVHLIGTSANGDVRSGLFVGTAGIGSAGDLTIKTGRLIVQDGARVSASTVQGSTGKGGSIIINTGELSVLNGADVTVSSLGSGEAGNLEVAAHSISLDNKGKFIATTNSGNGGNITLKELDLLLLQRQSQISTTAGPAKAGGDGGNITIDSDFIVAVPSENSDITANAFEGKGGSIQITAQGIFGIERREQLTPLNDITAVSQQNPVLNGVVEINTPDVDPNRGLIALPTQLFDVTGLIAQACPGGVGSAANKFVVTGRGGLPPNPNEALSSDAIQVDWVTLNPGVENSSSPAVSTQPTAPEPAPIVEAQGWVIGANGEVVLTASAPTVTPNTSWSTPPQCHASFFGNKSAKMSKDILLLHSS